MNNYLARIVIALLLSGSMQTVMAQEVVEPHKNILAAVSDYIRSHIADDRADYDFTLGGIDSRLRLSRCSQPLEVKPPYNNQLSGNISLSVKCPDAKSWSLYLSASINRYKQVYQTQTNLTRGHILTRQDVALVRKNVSRLRQGYFTNIEPLLGMEVQRRLRQNQVLEPAYVRAPLLVKRGDTIPIIARNSQFSIRMKAKALMNGAKGDRIRVKNTSSNRIVEGVVTPNGEILVN